MERERGERGNGPSNAQASKPNTASGMMRHSFQSMWYVAEPSRIHTTNGFPYVDPDHLLFRANEGKEKEVKRRREGKGEVNAFVIEESKSMRRRERCHDAIKVRMDLSFDKLQ